MSNLPRADSAPPASSDAIDQKGQSTEETSPQGSTPTSTLTLPVNVTPSAILSENASQLVLPAALACLTTHSSSYDSLQTFQGIRQGGSTLERVSTDIIVPISPRLMSAVKGQSKTYDFHRRFADDVVWLWFYETAPMQAITHIALTGKPKRPGQLIETAGIGNSDFNKGLKGSRHGYPILKLFAVKQPISRNRIESKYGVRMGTSAEKASVEMILDKDVWLNISPLFEQLVI